MYRSAVREVDGTERGDLLPSEPAGDLLLGFQWPDRVAR
jgi:hypothetical protein